MTFSVRENADPRWTIVTLDHIEKYQTEYGTSFPPAVITDQRRKVVRGAADSRGVNTRVFELVNNDEHVGDVVLVYSHGIVEVDVAVFDSHQGRGFARKGLEQVLSRVVPDEYSSVQGTIRTANRNPDRVRRLLTSCSFRRLRTTETGLEIWQYP